MFALSSSFKFNYQSSSLILFCMPHIIIPTKHPRINHRVQLPNKQISSSQDNISFFQRLCVISIFNLKTFNPFTCKKHKTILIKMSTIQHVSILMFKNIKLKKLYHSISLLVSSNTCNYLCQSVVSLSLISKHKKSFNLNNKYSKNIVLVLDRDKSNSFGINSKYWRTIY